MIHRPPNPNSATKPVMSILAAEHMAGYRDGVSTINQVVRDEAHEEGRAQGWQEAKVDRKWWGRVCFLCGIATSALFYVLVMA